MKADPSPQTPPEPSEADIRRIYEILDDAQAVCIHLCSDAEGCECAAKIVAAIRARQGGGDEN